MVIEKKTVSLKRTARAIIGSYASRVNDVPPSIQPLIMGYAASCLKLALGDSLSSFRRNPIRTVKDDERAVYLTCVNMIKARAAFRQSYLTAIADKNTPNNVKYGALIRNVGYDLALMTLIASIKRADMDEVKKAWRETPVLPGGDMKNVNSFLKIYKANSGTDFIPGQYDEDEFRKLFLRPGFTK